MDFVSIFTVSISFILLQYASCFPSHRQFKDTSSHLRKARSVGGDVSWTNRSIITWDVSRPSHYIEFNYTLQIVEHAFKLWARSCPLRFIRNTNHPDIEISFDSASEHELNCPIRFDKGYRQLAHAWARGDIHMHDVINASRTSDPEAKSGKLLQVLVHEIGHVLGLNHSDTNNLTIMWPSTASSTSPEIGQFLELPVYDQRMIQKLYGKCSTDFDALIDVPGPAANEPNTLIFKNEIVWLYSNILDKVEANYPQFSSSRWKNFPSRVDAVLQLSKEDSNAMYIISGHDVYFFEPSKDELRLYVNETKTHYPRNLLQMWDCFGKETFSHLNTAYYHKETKTIYFFVRDKVFKYNTKERKCKPSVTLSNFLSNVHQSTTDHPSGIDFIYRSTKAKNVTLVSGKQYWHVKRRNLQLRGPFPFTDKFKSVCSI